VAGSGFMLCHSAFCVRDLWGIFLHGVQQLPLPSFVVQ
jgi:hypothetical protein